MPKVRTAKRGVAPQQIESPIRNPPVPFTLEERQELRSLFSQPVFAKAWHNAKLAKPSAFVAGNPSPLNTALGAMVGNNRLHEIRGWELFEAAILRQVNDPSPPKSVVQENYQAL